MPDQSIYKLMETIDKELNSFNTPAIASICGKTVRCSDCEYFVNSSCMFDKIRKLAREVIKTSQSVPKYILAANGAKIYGPASKEECEAKMKDLVNVEIIKMMRVD